MAEDDLLYRQIHPDWISTEGEPQSRAFLPFPKDGDKLSVYDGNYLSPEESHDHYTQVLDYESAGVVGLSRAEVQALNIPIQPDPSEDFPSHTLLDFSIFPSKKEKRQAARKLKEKANERKWLYQPQEAKPPAL